MGIKGNGWGYYLERLLILMHVAFYCAADELNTDFAGSGIKLPAVRQNVTAVQVGKDQVLVTWTIPGYHRFQSLSHKVSYAPVENGDQPTEQWKIINVTDSHAVIIGGLTMNKTYAIRVSPVNPLGQESMSQPALITMRVIEEYLIALDVRQIGAQKVLIQWDKLKNLTDIEVESVKRVVLNHKMSGIMAVDVHDVLDWKTKTHFLLRDVDPNNKHTFQLVVLFELRSQSPIISRPADFELVLRASDEPMLHLTADVEIYDMQQVQELSNFGYSRYTTTVTRCTRLTEENILNPDRYDKIKTREIRCNVHSKGEVVGTEISFFKDNNVGRSFVVTNNKILTWIMAHF